MSAVQTPAMLYDYWRSSASYRVRIALALAGIEYEIVSVDLLAGEQRSEAHLQRNPQGFVPVLELDGQSFTQSLAILEYLNTTREMGLLPEDPVKAAQVRALAYSVAVDVHPVCNLSVAAYASDGQEPARTEWMQRFITPGLAAFEAMAEEINPQPFCYSESPGFAEICLVPQLYNARRWGVDYSAHQRITALEAACQQLPAFESAAPENVKG